MTGDPNDPHDPRDPRSSSGPRESSPRSDLDDGLRSLSRAANGIAARLFGPKIIGAEQIPEATAISPDADRALSEASDTLGRVLQAAGRALQVHPLDPGQALEEAKAHRDDPVAPPEGWSPLTGGLMSLSEGLYKVTEGVLDKVAPRKPKTEGGDEEERDDEDDRDGPDLRGRAAGDDTDEAKRR